MSYIPFKNISQNKSSDEKDLEELLTELNNLVPKFVDSSTFKRDIFDKSDENHYTETFIRYFENENKSSRFSLMNQASLPNRRSSDLGICLKANNEHYIFCIEAKFLPPTDYVSGEYAAIKRYKKLEHGLSHRDPNKAKHLSECGILAYSKSDTFKSHLHNINDKIVTLSKSTLDNCGLKWDTSEKLSIVEMTETAYLKSKHPRNESNHIELHHFWVNINIKPDL